MTLLQKHDDEGFAERRALYLLVALAAILRLAVAALFPDQSAKFPDIVGYRTAALELLAGHSISNDLGMPGYVVLLAATGATIWGRLVADSALSAFSVWCVVRICREVWQDTHAGLAAGLVWAVHPFSVFYAVIGTTETLFNTLILLGFLAFYRDSFVLGSLAMAAAILTRPYVVILAPILVLVFSQLTVPLELRRALRNLAVFAGCTVVLMAPWWWHNFEKYHAFVPLTLGGSVVLYAGNNPMNHSGGGIGGIDYDPNAFAEITDPVARDRALRTAATRYILENPYRFVELAVMKFARLWRPWPYASEYSTGIVAVVSAVSFLPVLLCAIIGSIVGPRRQRGAVIPIFLFIGYTTAVHMVTIASLRYRFPIEPFLIILGAPVIADLGRRVVGRIRPAKAASVRS